MKVKITTWICLCLLFGSIGTSQAQTDLDGLMMAKRNLCGGFLYGHSQWKNYWEGTFYRDNANLGTVSSQSVTAMANYGITNKLNVLAMAPWVKNQASAGTLKGQQGIQDLTLLLKNEFWGHSFGKINVTTVGVIGGSVPLRNYVADYLPLAIGMRSKTVFGRLMADAQLGHWYATASGTYMARSMVTIDRDAYYTTELIQSNQVSMPNVWMYNLRLGWRQGADFVAEMVLDRMNTLGGFDMRKNDMPFLSNNMEATRLGVNFKIPVPKTNGLSIMASGMQTLAGRNMGKSTAIMAGVVYQAAFEKKEAAK